MIRLLLDQGMSRTTASILRAEGCEVAHVAEIGMARATDQEILDYARREGMVVVTLDADFHAQLALAGADQPSVIRIREERLRGMEQAALISRILALLGDELSRGVIVIATTAILRIRSLPVVRH